MQFKFSKDLEYQNQAIKAVVEIFSGCEYLNESKMREIDLQSYDTGINVISNHLAIDDNIIINNLSKIQIVNKIEESIDTKKLRDFTIEMETGTGKTYVYLRTIFELNKEYNLKKFIILVPSVAIREGVLKSISQMKGHFKVLYGINFVGFGYDSDKLNEVRSFIQTDVLQIMIMTVQSFNKDTTVMKQAPDRFYGNRPIDLVANTNPIIILDEPQNMESDLAKEAIAELNPLFKLRYSATHKDVINLVFKLTPIEAYKQGLVKKIEVYGIQEENDNEILFKVQEIITSKNKKPTAKVKISVRNSTNEYLQKKIILKSGDVLKEKTKNEIYQDLIVTEINARDGFVELSNNIKYFSGNGDDGADSVDVGDGGVGGSSVGGSGRHGADSGGVGGNVRDGGDSVDVSGDGSSADNVGVGGSGRGGADSIGVGGNVRDGTDSGSVGGNVRDGTDSGGVGGNIRDGTDGGDGADSFGEGGVGDESKASKEEIFRVQIRETIRTHFNKQKNLLEHKIKVLSLFFIDRVNNYINNDSLLRKIFNEEFDKLKKNFELFKNVEASEVHTGYFASKKEKGKILFEDSISGVSKKDKEVYDLIMKDKERLLSFNEKISFIFSHSALKEGWDNPNIFQICTLRDTKSQMKKRQEVGRGLRLPVNQNGDRVYNSNLNILTIIPNESYKSFCEIYQKELDELCYKEKIKPTDAKKENIKANRKNKDLESVDSKKSRATIYNKTKNFFEIKTDELVKNCINVLNKLEVQNIQIEVSGGEFICAKRCTME